MNHPTRLLIAIGVVIGAFAVSGCGTQFNPATYRTFLPQVVAQPAPSAHSVDFHGLPLRSGDIIVSESDSAVGLVISLIAESYRPYIHAGIISIEDGKAYVYEAVGVVKPRPGRHALEGVGGGVRRVSLASHLQGHAVAKIYSPPPHINAEQLATFARTALNNEVPFDANFDLADPNSVYCAEFVAHAIHAAGGAPRVQRRRTPNPSLDTALDWLGIRAPHFYLVADLVEGWGSVALISERYSQPQIAARFAFKAALHERFSTDQKIGNLIRWQMTGPRVREPVHDAFLAVMDAAESQPTAAQNRHDWMAKLLQTHFGNPRRQIQLAGQRDETQR